ncbi:MAG: response regulator [Desulfuromonadales bacterium]
MSTTHKVMVIDDNEDMLHVYERILTQEGFEVITASSGGECLTLIETLQPDIFLMDVILPDWNGIELVRTIKENPKFAGSLCVLMSGLKTGSDDKIDGLKAGAVDYLYRPVPNKEVLAKVRSLIKVKDFQESLEDINNELDRLVEERTKELAERVVELRESEEQNRTILETAMDGFWQVDTTGRILEVNETYCRMSGYGRQELLSMTVSDLEVIENPAQTAARIKKIMTRGEDRFESQHRCKDGKIIDVEISVQFRSIDGGRCVAFFRDITGRKQMEIQLRHSQKMEAVGQLAGGVAHDLNNILTVIMGYSSLLLMDSQCKEKQKEQVEQIVSSAEKAANLTRGLLAFSRKQQMLLARVNLVDIVTHTHTFIERLIDENILIKMLLQESVLPVLVDSGQIEQVIVNLVTNARDAMLCGGTLNVECGRKLIDESFVATKGYGTPGPYGYIAVTDTGTGMESKILERIFEPFYTTKDMGKGTGLGLAIVYGIVKQHKGFIDVVSIPGQGSAFTVFIPLSEDGTVEASVRTQDELPPVGKETILVAEDDPAIRKFLENLLTSNGYQVILSEDGNRCVEAFKTYSDSVDLLLLDVIMPNGNGAEAFEKIKALKPDIKALFMSGYTSDILENHGFDYQAIEFIIKPLNPFGLLRKIRSILSEP